MQRHPLSDGILYSTWKDIPKSRNWSWLKFTPREFASRRDGEFYWHPRTFNAIQTAREIFGQPLTINSAHRSWLHNAAIGGAPRSAHLHIALDVSTHGYSRMEVYQALVAAGFKSFGYYVNFIHTDLRPGRRWFGSPQAKKLWQPLFDMEQPEIRL